MKNIFPAILILLLFVGQGCLDPDVDLAQGLADSGNALIGKSNVLILNEPGIPRNTPKSYSKLIRAESGGIIEFEKAGLNIPPGALKIDTIITITRFTDHRDRNIPLPVAQSYTGYYLIEPENLILDASAELTINGDSQNLPNADSRPDTAIFRYDGQNWMQLPGTNSPNSSKVKINSFALFKLYADLTDSINISYDKFEISRGFAHLNVNLELSDFYSAWGKDSTFGCSGSQYDMNTLNTGAMKYMLILKEIKPDNSLEFIASKHLYLTGVHQIHWYNYIEDFKFNPGSWIPQKENFIPDQALYSIEDPDGIHDVTGLPEWHACEIYFENNKAPLTKYHDRTAVSAPIYSENRSLFRLPGANSAFKEFFSLQKMSPYSTYIIQAKWELVHGTQYNPSGAAATAPFKLSDISPDPLIEESINIAFPEENIFNENDRIYFEARINNQVSQMWKYMTWSSSINGIFSRHNQFYYADLIPGQHVITLKIELPSKIVLEDKKYITIKAENSENRPPVIISTPQTQALTDKLYCYDANAQDPENEDIYYSLIKHPAGMSVEKFSGLISWTPGYMHVGINEILLESRDRWGLSDTQSFEINVTDPVNDTTPPELTWVSPLMGETVEGIIDLYVSASDDRWMNQVKFHVITDTGKLFLGSDSSVPYKIPMDTTGLADKKWQIQATAIDKVGNRTVKEIEVFIKN